MRRVHEIIVTVENQEVLHLRICVCVCTWHMGECMHVRVCMLGVGGMHG